MSTLVPSLLSKDYSRSNDVLDDRIPNARRGLWLLGIRANANPEVDLRKSKSVAGLGRQPISRSRRGKLLLALFDDLIGIAADKLLQMAEPRHVVADAERERAQLGNQIVHFRLRDIGLNLVPAVPTVASVETEDLTAS